MSDVVIGLSLQKSYLNKTGAQYLGEHAETLKIRLRDYFKSINGKHTVYFTREIHNTNDIFYRGSKSHAIVGSSDIEIIEILKPYPKFMINTSRYNALFMTPLESELKKAGFKRVYLVGVETHTNVLFTAEELRNRGYEITVYEPLVASQDSYMHAAGINILSNTLSVDVA
jgi:nicotinamidase-related amidase